MKLRHWIYTRDMSRTTFARLVESTTSTINNVCRGRPPGRKLAMRIVSATDGEVSYHDLFEGAAASDTPAASGSGQPTGLPGSRAPRDEAT